MPGEEPEITVSLLETIVGSIGDIVEGAVDWMGEYLGAITATGNSLLLFCVIFSFVGVGIGILRRLKNL